MHRVLIAAAALLLGGLPAGAVTRTGTVILAGTNVTVSPTNGVGRVTVNASGGGGGASWTAVEVDWGLTAARSAKLVVVDAAVTASSKIMALQSGIAATGRQADENEMDAVQCRAIPASGSFTMVCVALEGLTHGLFKINYTVN